MTSKRPILFTGLISGIIFISLSLSSCVNTPQQDGSVLEFQGREINVDEVLSTFPFSQFTVSDDGSKLLFFKNEDAIKLQYLDIENNTDFEGSEDVVNIDFSKRNCWAPKFNSYDSMVYWIGDEKNDEVINIYRTSLRSNEVEKLTNVPYISAWSFDPNGTQIAYVARLGQNEERLDELRVLNLLNGEDRLILKDNPSFRFTWGDIGWQPDGKGVFLLALKEADRTQTNVCYIDFESPSINPLLKGKNNGSLLGSKIPKKWVTKDLGIFISDVDGFSNLYGYNLSAGEVKQITAFEEDISDAEPITVNGDRYVVVLQNSPLETKIHFINPFTGEILWEGSSPNNLEIGAILKESVLMLEQGTNVVFKLEKFDFTTASYSNNPILDIPSISENKLVFSEKVEKLKIPTFDSVDGSVRLIHAYLYVPKNPLPKEKAMVMIQSFYGGENEFQRDYQIYNSAGIFVLSPSPRGSAGFGKDFAALNDRDLGGNEILDIIYCGKYISELLDIPSERVGVFGMSHGGYATMRLMTFPGEVNGVTANFPFGFGVEIAGFSDIIYQHKTSNIPDWTLLEAGDPQTDSVKLMDRSPINHVDKITGPLLLVHGTHDNRVNIQGSVMMSEALKDIHKPYKFLKLDGMGHGIKGKEMNLKFYKTFFEFISDDVIE